MSKNTNVNSQGMFKLPGEISIKVGRCPSSLPPLPPSVLPSEVSPVESLLLAKGTHPDLGDISNNLPPLEGEGFSSMNWPGNDPRADSDTVGMQHIDPSVVDKDSLSNQKLSEETGVVKSEILEMNSRTLPMEGDKRNEVKCSSSSSNVQPQADSRPLQTSTTSQTSGNDKSPSSAENGGKKANSSLNWFASIATQSDVLDPKSPQNGGSGGEDPSSAMDVDVISRSKGTSSSSTPQDSANPVPSSSLIPKDAGDETNKTMIESSDGSLLYSKHDVLLNRGNAANRHEGNIFYRSLITESKSKYDNGFRKTKTSLTWWIISQVRGRGGRFLQKDKSGEKWVEANETVIRRKVAQAYRDTRRRMLVQNIP